MTFNLPALSASFIQKASLENTVAFTQALMQEYEPLCVEQAEIDAANACISALNQNFNDCAGFERFMGGFLVCIESNCGVVCEDKPEQYQSLLDFYEEEVSGGTCDFGEACALMDVEFPYEPAGSSYEYAFFCADEDVNAFVECVNGLYGFTVSDCRSAAEVLAGYTYCAETVCDVECSVVEEYTFDFVQGLINDNGCTALDPFCALTLPPTSAPTTKSPTSFPTAVQTQAPASGSNGDGSELLAGGEFYVGIIGALAVLVALLSVALLVAVLVKAKRNAAATTKTIQTHYNL